MTRGRWAVFAAALVVASAIASGARTGVAVADDGDARYIRPVPWQKPHIVKTLGLGYPELGLELDVSRSDTRTIGDKSCIVGNVVSFDVDDRYAFDIDEPVDLTITYAPEFTTASPFLVLWDKNGGDGHGVAEVVPAAGATLREATVRLDRARLAGLGARGTDIAVGARRGLVAVCDVAIARTNQTHAPAAFGTVRLEVKDAASGKTVPARVGLYDESGRAPLASDRAVSVRRFTDPMRRHWLNRRTMWPSANRQAFYVDGRYKADVPTGSYELVVTRGPEYRAYRGSLEVRRGQTTTATVSLQRYDDLPSRGWYSGESHIHLRRETAGDPAVWTQIAAEDVHVANLLEMGNIARTYFANPAWGKAGVFARDGYILVPGQEDPRTGHRGHTIHWNVDRQQHAEADWFYEYHRVFEATRRSGALTGYAHLGELFHARRGLALDVPFGLVDFIEVLQGGRLSDGPWYSFLNLGFKLLPAGGSDYPYFGPTLPGVERTYVKVDGPLSADAWFGAYRRGRTYVTNGPFLDFTINGRQMGDELHVARGAALDIVAEARLNPDVDKLARLELVVLGDVAKQEQSTGADRLQLRTRLTADHSMWIAVRAYGTHEERGFTTVAHTAPIFVVVDGEPTWKTSAVADLVQQQRTQLQQLMLAAIDPADDLESFETADAIVAQWPAQRARLQPRVDEADRRYRQLLDRMRGGSPPD